MQKDVTLTHLKRITGWNKQNYNPQTDKYFIEDALWSISIKIKPYELTQQEIECLTISLKKATDRKSVYKTINSFVKNYLKK